MPEESSSWRRRRLPLEHVWCFVDELRKEPDLEYLDVWFLAMQGLERVAETCALPVGVPLETRHFRRPWVLAADGIVRASDLGGFSWFAAVRQCLHRFAVWTEEVLSLVDLRNAGCELPPRETRVLDLWLTIRRQCGPVRDWSQFHRAARNAHRELDLPHDQKKDKEDVRRSLVLFRVLTEGTAGAVFISKDGRMLLGFRQVRDRLSKALGKPRLRRGSEPPRVVGLDQVLAVEDRKALEAVQAARSAEVRDWLEERKRGTKAGSGRRIVLDSFPDLCTGEESIGKLAKRVRRSKSALQRAFEKELKAFRARFGSDAA